eukprot:maker-scaffold125_size330479-snap-gene-2.12 protein:Tk06891 transcript:maker-scaffold125_size330479-snap-gene-2.12-mRNA-1 annotation:"hypothetical protein DAPPUDRAFT_102163"
MERKGSYQVESPEIFVINDHTLEVVHDPDLGHGDLELKLHTPHEEFQVYKRRWYFLLIYSVFCLHQCLVWNTFGPIAFAVQFAYDWSDSTLAMMPNWGCIMFIIFLFPLTWLLEKKGVRPAFILVSGLVTLGCCLRTFSQDADVFLYMAHIGAILNGIAGATVMSAPPVMATLWFPENERIFATSISQSFNLLGNGVSFLIGPLIVPFDESLDSANITDADLLQEINQTKERIQMYMIGDAVFAAILFLAFILYFPNQPKKAPCASSSVERTNFYQGIREIAGNKQLWLCCLAYSISNGVQAAWQGVMALNFAPLGVTDADVGTIGFVSVFAQCFLGCVVAFAQDRFRDYIKLSILVFLSLATLCFVWLALLCFGVIPFSMWQLYAATIAAVSFNYSSVPLFFEYAVMMAYPIPEGLVGAFLTGMLNLVALLFFLVFFIKDIGYDWMNYALILGLVIALPLVILTKKPLDFTRDVKKKVNQIVEEKHL